MAKAFEIPDFYRADLIGKIKSRRQGEDQRKKDMSPSIIDLGKVKFKLARHFGFCYGVQNAIEIAYKAIAENPGKRIFLLSEMIHNPQVNADLQERGIRFLQTTEGKELISLSELKADDIVIIPAFGTSLETFAKLNAIGIQPSLYDTTCPFVEKVWKRSEQLGEAGFTVVIHGKHSHEETRATFSHARVKAQSIVVRDKIEAQIIADFILGRINSEKLMAALGSRCSSGFDPATHLQRIGVVNQTTMLAEETYEISQMLKNAMLQRFGEGEEIGLHFADTRDTLCYATSENQRAIQGLMQSAGDLALIVGGYNSSNTSHLVELLEQQLPTYFIKDENEIISKDTIRYLNLKTKQVEEYKDWLPDKSKVDILLSAGASCPDAVVDRVIRKIAHLLDLDEQLKVWEAG